MKDGEIPHQFPAAFTYREYDVFEKLSDGSLIWRTCICGLDKVDMKLRELIKGSDRTFLAVNVQDPNSVISLIDGKIEIHRYVASQQSLHQNKRSA
jgi:hypothetical protein